MIKLDAAYYFRLRALVKATGKDRTMQNLCASAVRRMITDIEATENDGKPFTVEPDPEPAPIKKGRKK
jgi:hypothetical protein